MTAFPITMTFSSTRGISANKTVTFRTSLWRKTRTTTKAKTVKGGMYRKAIDKSKPYLEPKCTEPMHPEFPVY